MKTGIIYARQSFGVEEGSVSIDVQIDNCRNWAKRNGINIIGIYNDANTSSELYPYCAEGIEACRVDRGFQMWRKEQRTRGRKEYKEGLGKAFEAIASKKPDCLIVNTSNRLGRTATNSNLNNFLTAYLMEHNCSIVEAQSNSITDFGDRIMTAFRAMRDALDYQSVFEKRKSSMESVARRINSFKVVTKAYGTITEKGVIRFDSEKAGIIRYVFDSVCKGTAYSAILNTLNREYRDKTLGRQWYSTNIRNIIKNLVYCGYAKNQQGEVQRATNIPEPIISYSQYLQANKVYREKKAGYQHYNRAGESIHWLPYSGYLYCECGRRMLMQVDDGICYQCVNGKEHKPIRLRINAENHGQDFYLALQPLFLPTCIDSRRRLEASRTINQQLDGLKANLAAKETGLKAKFRMINSDADYDLLKDDIATLKQEIAELKQEIAVAEEQRHDDGEAIAEKIATDICTITAGILLEQDDYQRLLRETVDRITVHAESITILLKDGKTIDLPRIKVDGRGKKVLPYATTDTEINENKKSLRYIITYHGGTENRTLAETDDYVIYIKGK